VDLFAASGGEEDGWGWFAPIGRWFNLAILAGAVAYLLKKPLIQYLSDRKENIQKEIREAQEAREAAEKKLALMEARIQDLDSELEAIRLQAEEDAESERKRIIEDGEREAAKNLETARRQITGLTSAAKQDLKAYAGQLSINLAKKQIERELDSKIEQQIVDRFVVEVAGLKEDSK
jgi:F-type H+-transporting ATPase subunit b